MKNETLGTNKASEEKKVNTPEPTEGKQVDYSALTFEDFQKLSPEQQAESFNQMEADRRIKYSNMEAMKVGNDELIKENDELRKENEGLLRTIEQLRQHIRQVDDNLKLVPIQTKLVSSELEPKLGHIIAERDGQQTYFTETSWDLLGNNKGGWRKVVAIPKEVEGLRGEE